MEDGRGNIAGGDDHVVTIHSQKELISSIVERIETKAEQVTHEIEELRTFTTITMCKIPNTMRAVKVDDDEYYKYNKVYEPMLVSIGPYHWGKKDLHPMEDVKLRYFRDLINRHTGNKDAMRACMVDERVLQKARACYFNIEKCECVSSDEKFLEMLVLDGCFVVELLLKHAEHSLMMSRINMHKLPHDLVLLENQVPFFILQIIYDKIQYDTPKPRCSLFDLAIFYLDNRKMGRYSYKGKEVKHLLHLLYICRMDNLDLSKEKPKSFSQRFSYILHSGDKKSMKKRPEFSNVLSLPLVFSIFTILFLKPLRKLMHLLNYLVVGLIFIFVNMWNKSERSFVWNKSSFCEDTDLENSSLMKTTIPSAEEINNAGVWFDTRFSHPYNMFFYDKDGSMNGAAVEIHGNFFTELENMLVFEQIFIISKEENTSFLSSYVFLMRNLVKTTNDVVVLKRHGILKSNIYTDAKIREFFKKHRSGLEIPKEKQETLHQEFKQINKFCRRSHNKRKAKLITDYFYSPLIISSFIGFIILLVPTLLQTIYTINPNM